VFRYPQMYFTDFNKNQYDRARQRPQDNINTSQTEESILGKGAKDKPRDVDDSYYQNDVYGRSYFANADSTEESILGKGAKDKPRDVDGSYYQKDLSGTATSSDAGKSTFEQIKETVKDTLGLNTEQQARDTTGSYFEKDSNVRTDFDHPRADRIKQESEFIAMCNGEEKPGIEESILGKGAKDKPRDVDGSYYHKDLSGTATSSDVGKSTFEQIKETVKDTLGLNTEQQARDTAGSYFEKDFDVKTDFDHPRADRIRQESEFIAMCNAEEKPRDAERSTFADIKSTVESVLGKGPEDKPRDVDGSYYHKDLHADTSADAAYEKSLFTEVKEAVKDTLEHARKDSGFVNEPESSVNERSFETEAERRENEGADILSGDKNRRI